MASTGHWMPWQQYDEAVAVELHGRHGNIACYHGDTWAQKPGGCLATSQLMKCLSTRYHCPVLSRSGMIFLTFVMSGCFMHFSASLQLMVF